MRPRFSLTRELQDPTEYARALDGEFKEWAFNEEVSVQHKGSWRRDVFKVPEAAPVDLEIGTGNGYHFAHLAKANPERSLVGVELKFKPLIQSIKRARAQGSENARILRYDAAHLENVFAPNEVDNVYIHFPDPWSKKRQWKHRLIQTDFLKAMHTLMRDGAYIDFKTDSLAYFEWATEFFHASPFTVTRETRDLHQSEWASSNFVTHFETIFLGQGIPINYARLEKK